MKLRKVGAEDCVMLKEVYGKDFQHSGKFGWNGVNDDKLVNVNGNE